MRKLLALLVCSYFITAANTAAFACDSAYDPATGVATLRCVEIPGDSRSFTVSLRAAAGSNFAMESTFVHDIRQPFITGLQILTSPFPIALVSGFYSDGCWSPYKRPTVSQSGAAIDIHVTARIISAPEIIACTLAIVPFVQAVAISPAGDVRNQTYSVNGRPITPTF